MTSGATKVTTLGRKKFTGGFPCVNPPTYRASTILYPSLDEFEKGECGKYDYVTYGRYGSPTHQAFSEILCELEGADGAILTSSGLAAITVALMSFLKAGDHMLLADSVYGPTRDFCTKMLAGYGVEVEFFAPDADGDVVRPLMRPNTKVVFLESPGSLTFEMQDIASIADVAHEFGAVVMADNTWATPLYFKPFEHGIDISIHAATKYIGGHSDLLMGTITAKGKHLETLKAGDKLLGVRAGGDDVSLALRGIRTMALRVEHHYKAGMEIAQWLESQPQVKRVLHPALPSDAGHARWKKYMSGACGLFGVELKDGYTRRQLAAMLDGMEFFKMGFSWGGYESLIIRVHPCALRNHSGWGKDSVLLRINVGLEDLADLKEDLEAGLKRLDDTPPSAQGACC
jgi:cystathionine beta-lyase